MTALPRGWVVEIHNDRPVRVVVRGHVPMIWLIPHDCTSEATGETWQQAYEKALELAMIEANVATP